MKTLNLREYTEEYRSLTPAEVDVLRSKFRCQVTRADTGEDYYTIRPQDAVGAAVVGDTSIVIRPKLPIARVLFLIAHAIDPHWAGDAQLTTADSLTDAVAGLFAHLCDQALHAGLLRGYRDHREQLHTVRGRIDFTEQLRASPGRNLPLAVSYQSHDDDIPENRLLAAAVETLHRLPVYAESARRWLARLRITLAGVRPVRFRAHEIPVIRWTRLNQHYRPAVELARLILSGAEADLAAREVQAAGLVVRMSEVFENFVRNATRRALGASDQEFPSGKHAPKLYLDDRRRLNVQPDLSRWVDGRCHFVGELKYRYDAGNGDAPNVYQTVAYALAAGVPHASLVYADGPETGAQHYLPGLGARIHIRHLDLDTEPADLLGQIRALADHIDRLTPADPHRGGSASTGDRG
jgi:5-methylcytosine-specific restriction enzyme subunit McrC